MKIQQQEPTFGRLYMPTKMQIQRVFGEELANKADLAREELTELAKNKDIFVSTYLELTEARAIPLFKVKVAQEKAERYADMTGINTFKEAKTMVEKQGEVVAALASAFAEADKRNAVAEAVTGERLKCLNERVTTLEGITKVVVPNSSICPGWGTVTITPATTPTTAG